MAMIKLFVCDGEGNMWIIYTVWTYFNARIMLTSFDVFCSCCSTIKLKTSETSEILIEQVAGVLLNFIPTVQMFIYLYISCLWRKILVYTYRSADLTQYHIWHKSHIETYLSNRKSLTAVVLSLMPYYCCLMIWPTSQGSLYKT